MFQAVVAEAADTMDCYCSCNYHRVFGSKAKKELHLWDPTALMEYTTGGHTRPQHLTRITKIVEKCRLNQSH